MKRIRLTIILLPAAFAAVFCSRNPGAEQPVIPPGPEREGQVRLEITAGAPTKTALTSDGKIVWGSRERLKVFESAGGTCAAYTSDEGISPDEGRTMSFGVTLDAKAGSEFAYNAVYPAASYVDAGTPNPSSVRMSLPVNQTSAERSFDPAADILLAKKQTSDNQPETLNMQFRRPVAIGSLVLQGLPVSEELYDLTFSATKGGDPVAIAGETTFDLPNGGRAASYGSETAITIDCSDVADNGFKTGVTDYDYRDFFAGTLEEGATYTPSDATAGVPGAVNFTCWPFELGTGDTFSIRMFVGSSIYSRTVTIPAGREFLFTEGDVSLFTVNMASASVTPLPEMITAASFGVAASPSKADAVPVSSYDAGTRTWTLYHVSDFSLLDDDYTYSEYVSVLSTTTSGGTRTISCKRGGATQDYKVVLADYVAPGDSYRPAGTWTLRWNDEYTGTDWDHVTYVRSEPSGSYASVHHDSTREDLVTVSEGAVHIWAKTGTNGEEQTKSIRNGNEVNVPVLDGFVTGGIRQNYWDIWREDSQNEHTYIRSSEAGSAWRIDARVRMTQANGFWPAVWLIPYRMTRNPHGGEIDLMECATYVSKVYQTVHNTWTASDEYKYTSAMKSSYPQTMLTDSFGFTDWHLFSVVVTPAELKYYIDGVLKFTWTNREDAMGATGEYAYQNKRATVEGMEPTSSQRTYQYPYNVTDYRLLLTAQLGLNANISSNDTETWNWMDDYSGGSPIHKLDGTGIPAVMDVDFIRYYTQD